MSDPISLADYLAQNGSLTYANVGVSMLPLLRQGRDLFTVEKKGEARCRIGDVILYRRKSDPYVLHRVVEVRPDDYVVLGDNCLQREYGIRDEDIMGIMSSFVRSGRKHSVHELPYRLYSKIWVRGATLRIALTRAKNAAKRHIKKAFHET